MMYRTVVVTLEVPESHSTLDIHNSLMQAVDPDGRMEKWRIVGIVAHKPTTIFDGKPASGD